MASRYRGAVSGRIWRRSLVRVEVEELLDVQGLGDGVSIEVPCKKSGRLIVAHLI